MSNGKIFLIPTPLGEGALDTLPPGLIRQTRRLDYFLVEKLRTARRFLRAIEHPVAIDDMIFQELNKHSTPVEIDRFLDPVKTGRSAGVLSEAGCPGVADPGALLAARAHEAGIEVIPMVGPSSILLALMASGMNGQGFTFHGYLSHNKKELAGQLKNLENLVARTGHTQLFMETPYRNRNILEVADSALQANTRFCIAADLTLDTQYVRSLNMADWKKTGWPDIHKRPAVFLVGK